jgi:hypothetical protein
MTMLRNERGMALVMVMLMSLIGLVIVSSLLFMLTLGSQTSGAHGFYRTADEAAIGGIEISTRFLDNRGTLNVSNWNPLPTFQNQACLQDKLNVLRGTTWDPTTSDWANCAIAPIQDVSMDATSSPDVSFSLKDLLGGEYAVFTKIVDTVPGNSDVSGVMQNGTLDPGGSGAGVITPALIPYLYRVEVQAQNKDSPRERARYSVLYAY